MFYCIFIIDFILLFVFINFFVFFFNVKIGWELVGGFKVLNVVVLVGEWISEGWSGWYRLLEGIDVRWCDWVYGVDDVNNIGIKVFVYVYWFMKWYCILIGMWYFLILELWINIFVYVLVFLYFWEVLFNIVCIGEWVWWWLLEIKRLKNWVCFFCCNIILYLWMIKYLFNWWVICIYRDLVFIFIRYFCLRFIKF